jgi:hypothetical protein
MPIRLEFLLIFYAFSSLACADMAAMVESTTSSIHSLETSHNYSQFSLLLPPSSPSSLAVRTSWNPAERARLPSEAAQRPESAPPCSAVQVPVDARAAPPLASHSSRVTHGVTPRCYGHRLRQDQQCVMKGKTVIVLHTWKDALWAVVEVRMVAATCWRPAWLWLGSRCG